jgi:ribulose-phosphate 3-epimerase
MSAAGEQRRVTGPVPLLEAPRVAPSILSADFGRLREQVAEVLAAGARVIHCDVMDGHFVPPLTLGPNVVAALREQARDGGAMLDVHLMIERPERQIAEFARAGADMITIHAESTPNLHYTLAQIRDAGALAGLAINPGTPVGAFDELADDVDVALCMTVNPGWGGQEFIAGSVEKVARLRALLPDNVALEVDGGIDADTAPRCAGAGATLFVAGSHVFGRPDPGAAYAEIAAAVGDPGR